MAASIAAIRVAEARLRCREVAHALATIRETSDQALDLAYRPLNNLFDKEEAALAIYERSVAEVRTMEGRWSAASFALAYEKELMAGHVPWRG
jgi:hypothetical protein